MGVMHPGGLGRVFLTDAGVTAVRIPRSSTPSTMVGPRVCQPLVAHWAWKVSGRSSRTFAHFPCRPTYRRSHGKSPDPPAPAVLRRSRARIGIGTMDAEEAE